MQRRQSHRAQGPWPARLISWFLVTIATVLALAFALYGAWVGSTLAIHHEQPVWIALVGSVVAFAILPLVWELLSDRDQVGGRIRDTILRSSFLSAVLLVVLVLTHADTTFVALVTRGDWFLGGSQTPTAQSVRRLTHTLTDGFEWLDGLSRRISFGAADTTGGRDPSASAVSRVNLADRPTFPIPGTDWTWPLDPAAGPHPAVDALPEALRGPETTPAALGQYFASEVSDEYERAKAIHDYVVTQISYDHAGLLDGSYRRLQDADTVLRRRSGVCSGLSNLFAAIGEAAGLEAVVVSGQIRWTSDYGNTRSDSDFDGPLVDDERGHAWNAVRIGERWHLVDTTWDLPSRRAPYRTDYLFIPPQLMTWSHLPRHEEWQLLKDPLSLSEWLRQPTLHLEAAKLGISLEEGVGPVLPRSNPLVLVVDNPHGHRVTVSIRRAQVVTLAELSESRLAGDEKKESDSYRCGRDTNNTRALFRCRPPLHRSVATIFARDAAAPADEPLWYIGSVTMDGP